MPLPLPREEYERDFATAESRAEFAHLLGRAQDVFRVDVLSDRPREYAYARTAACVTQRSQLVVALWDGTPPASHAGTASLVQFALDSVPEGYGDPKSPLDTAERRPVAHIMTPRRDASSLAASAHAVRWLSRRVRRRGDRGEAFDELWTRIDELNRDAARALPPSAIAGSDLLDAAEAGTLSPRLRYTHRCYAATDALSIHFQRRTRRTLGWLLVLAFVAAAALQGDPLARAAAFSLNGLYVGALAAAYAVWLWSRRAR